MYTKKFIFSAFTIPGLIYVNSAADFQERRNADK